MSYSPILGRWMEQDPLGTANDRSGSFAMSIAGSGVTIGGATLQYADGMNLYQYVRSNPTNNLDPSGLLVDLFFNRKTGELTARDRDTGAEAKVDAGCAFSGDATHATIPLGSYDILERKDDDGKHAGWYRLDPHDSASRNDKKDDGEGKGRGEFRLHPGRVSHGCVTVRKDKDDCMKQYDALRKLLDGTKKEKPGDEGYGGNIDKFGNLIVYDDPATTQPAR